MAWHSDFVIPNKAVNRFINFPAAAAVAAAAAGRYIVQWLASFWCCSGMLAGADRNLHAFVIIAALWCETSKLIWTVYVMCL